MFYTFTWRARRPHARRARGDGESGPRTDARPQGKGGKRRKPGAKRERGEMKPKVYKAGPEAGKREKKIDPDNPFAAALMALKEKK